MSSLTKILPQDLLEKLKSNEIQLIDIREPDEFQREHIAGAVSVPLSIMGRSGTISTGKPTAFMCRSGMRTDANCIKLAACVTDNAFMLEGGIDNWKKQGLAVVENKKAPLEISRQVQISAGSLVLIGVLLSHFVHPNFIGLSAFVGAGFVVAGISGWCGMASMLRIMPWNQPTSTPAS